MKRFSARFLRCATLLGLILFAGSFSASAQSITITIVNPLVGSFSGTSLNVIVAVASQFEIQTVTASVESVAANLTFSDCAYYEFGLCRPGWTGTLSLSSLVRGQKLLTVIATDVFENAGQGTVTFTYDQPPNVNVQEPQSEPSPGRRSMCTLNAPMTTPQVVRR